MDRCYLGKFLESCISFLWVQDGDPFTDNTKSNFLQKIMNLGFWKLSYRTLSCGLKVIFCSFQELGFRIELNRDNFREIVPYKINRIEVNESMAVDFHYWWCENYGRPLNITYRNIWWNTKKLIQWLSNFFWISLQI